MCEKTSFLNGLCFRSPPRHKEGKEKIVAPPNSTKNNLIQCQNAESCEIGGVTPPSVVKLRDYKIGDIK